MTVNDCLECSELYNENANLEMRIAAQKQLNKRLRVQRDALLAACEALLEAWEGYEMLAALDYRIQDQAAAAIAKARGDE
jgi:hypothetical protein